MSKVTDEIEINCKVSDLEGLLGYLRAKAPEIVTRKRNTYFESDSDSSFYARIEDIDDEAGQRRALTFKYGFQDDESGISRRKELTTAIEDAEFFETMFGIIGLKQAGQKSKVRRAFLIDDLEVAVDEWDTEELGIRVEIEGHDESKIKAFQKQIAAFISED